MILSKLKSSAVFLVITLSLVIGAYFYGVNTGKDKVNAKHLQEVQELVEQQRKLLEKDRKEKQDILSEVAKVISEIEIKNEVIYNATVKEIIKEPVYTECKFTPDVVQLVNQALRGNYNTEVYDKPPSNTELP